MENSDIIENETSIMFGVNSPIHQQSFKFGR
jgi:hypothetical protein